MKNLFLVLFVFCSFIYKNLNSQQSFDSFFKRVDLFMDMYVKNGEVDYAFIKRNHMQLDSIVNEIKSISLDNKMEESYNKAFLINTYNVLVIKSIIDHYPVTSPMDVDGFFKGIKHNVGGKKVTLNDLENKMIRAVYNDPRVHFVLVCGGRGCPPIIDKAYLPKTLEEQLDIQTKIALNNPVFIQVNDGEKKVGFSEIFKWYPKDFKTDKSANVLAYVNLYRDNKIPSTYNQSYYPYDWSINSQPTSGTNAKDPIDKPTSNILEYTPSKLMKKGKWDIKMFNNLYTQTRYADSDGQEFKNQPRLNFFTTSLEFYTGVTKDARINVGALFNIKSNNGNDQNPFSVFNFKTEEQNGVGIARAGLSNIGFSLKVSPFKKINNFSFQTTMFLPVFDDESNTFYLDKRSYVWDTKFFYDKSFYLDKFQLFAEIDVQYNFGELSDSATAGENAGERFANNAFAIPGSLFLSYFPNDKFTVYINAQHYRLMSTRETGFSQDFTFAGMGIKYQVTNDLNIELSTTRFVLGHDTGLGETYNLGLRYIL